MRIDVAVQWGVQLLMAAIVIDVARVTYARQAARTPGPAGVVGETGMVGTSILGWLGGRPSKVVVTGRVVLLASTKAIGWWRIRGHLPDYVDGVPVVEIVVGPPGARTEGPLVGLHERWAGQIRLPVAVLTDRRGVVMRAGFVNTLERWEGFSAMCRALLLGSSEVRQRLGVPRATQLPVALEGAKRSRGARARAGRGLARKG